MAWLLPLDAKFQYVPSSPVPDWAPGFSVLVLAAVAIIYAVRIQRRGGLWRRGRRSGVRRWGKSGDIRLLDTSPGRPPRNSMADPLNQMAAIHGVAFEVQTLLNASEARVLPVIEKTLAEIGKGHRVMAQTSMGEILRPKPNSGTSRDRKDAFASINSKRLDFAVFDRKGLLVCAVEYQGSGHYQGKAFVRDAVKREVVRKAGVSWIEVKPGDKPGYLRDQLRRALGEPPDSVR